MYDVNMKTYRCYNTNLKEVGGWSTLDKKGTVEIHDENNKLAFVINFGKIPELSVYTLKHGWKNGDGDFDKRIFQAKVVV